MPKNIVFAWGIAVDKLSKSLEQTLQLIAVSTISLLNISQTTTLMQVLNSAFPQPGVDFTHAVNVVFKGWFGYFYSFSPILNKEAK